jgi:gliding motility-associated protein GldE
MQTISLLIAHTSSTSINGTIVFSVLTILILLVCSAMISASEVAYFSMGPLEKEVLKNEEGKQAETARKLLKSPQDLLATILIANNFVNVGVVIISSFLLDAVFGNSSTNELFRFLIDVFLITTIILLVGEVIPKVYATKNGLTIAKFMAPVLHLISTLPPFSWLKRFLVNGTRLIHKYAKKRGVKISSDELEQILALTKEETTSEEEHKLLEGIIKFGNTDVKQIMRPRMEIVAIENTSNYTEVLQIILHAGYSRIPVYASTFDNIIGILYIKDLLPHLEADETFDWLSLVHKPFFVPENKKLDDLLKEFQSKKMHMSIVVDEYGGASGLATLEDVLEEIVGDITDEYDEKEINFTKISDNNYQFEGRTALVDFYKVLEIDGKEFEANKGESDTLGGFMVEQAGRILRNKEHILFEDFKLIVEKADKKRIKTIRVLLQELNNETTFEN